MSDYKNIIGKGVKFLSSNLDNDQAEGQIWYNSTDGKFRDLLTTEAWASGGALLSAKARYTTGGIGTQTAALAVGGYDTAVTAETEEYNGSGWAVGGALGTARYGIYTAGTQTAGLAAAGKTSTAVTNVEEYNGSSWSEVTNNSTARFLGSSCGTQTAGLIYGGYDGSTNVNNTEEYDGTNWTNGGNLNTSRNTGFSFGTQTAGVIAGGGPGSGNTDATEHYNGSAWTTVNSMGTARRSGGASIASPQSSGLAFGGFTSDEVTTTEKYDGTTWTAGPAMGTGRYGLGGAGDSSGSALAFGGQDNSSNIFSVTEEFTKSVNIITTSAWAAGGAMPAGKRVGGSSTGGSIVALTFGGDDLPMAAGQPQVKSTEEYDGSSWTSGGNVGNNVSRCAGSGTQTAGLGAGGYSTGTPWQTPNAAYIANAFEYDGSSWTNVTAMPITMDGHTAFGTQTAAVYGAGSQGPNPSPGPAATYRSKNTHHYNGSSWTSGGALNDFHSDTDASAGTQTAGVVFGGYNGNPLPASTTSLEEYNGSSWTSALTGLQSRSIGGGFGTQSLFLAAGGQDAPIPSSPGTVGYSFTTLIYNGTTLVTDANIATRRVIVGSDGVVGSAAGMICGGSTSYSTRTTATEEYTQGSTALNVKTITTS